MTERVEAIRRRHEEFVAQYSPGPDWEPCNQMSLDRGWLLAALAQAEREVRTWKDMGEKEHALAVQFATERDAARAEVERLNQALADLANESVSTDHVDALEADLARVRAQLKACEERNQ